MTDMLRCNHAQMRQPHPPHTWTPQPGMETLPCPGFDQRKDRKEVIAQAARTVRLRLGPNAIAMAQRGETIMLSGSEADAVADAVLLAENRHDADVRADTYIKAADAAERLATQFQEAGETREARAVLEIASVLQVAAITSAQRSRTPEEQK